MVANAAAPALTLAEAYRALPVIVKRVSWVTLLSYTGSPFTGALFNPLAAVLFQDRGVPIGEIGTYLLIANISMLGFGGLFIFSADILRNHKLVYVTTSVMCCALSCVLLVGAVYRVNWLIAVGYTLVKGFSAPQMPILDSSTLYLLGDLSHFYPFLRLFCSIGWATGALVSGYVLKFGVVIVFYSYVIGLAVDAALAFYQPITAAPLNSREPNESHGLLEPQKKEKASAGEFFRTFFSMLGSPSFVIFLAIVVAGGFAGATFSVYVVLYTQDTLKGSTLLCGLVTTVGAGMEAPAFLACPFVQRKIGPRGMVLVAYILATVRSFLYPLLTPATAWLVLGIQVLNGVQFAFMWNAGVALCDELAPPLVKASSQSIFSGMFFGVGSSIGLKMGGYWIDKYGAHTMFKLKGLVLLGATLVLAAQLVALRCRPGPVRGGAGPDATQGTGIQNVD